MDPHQSYPNKEKDVNPCHCNLPENILDHPSSLSTTATDSSSECPATIATRHTTTAVHGIKKKYNKRPRQASSDGECPQDFKIHPSSCPLSLHDPAPSWEASLAFYALSRSWIQATQRAQSHPHEAQYGCSSAGHQNTPVNLKLDPLASSSSSSPLAIACRYGAPPETVKAILQAEMSMVRRCIPNRGTPLHEAIMAYPNLEGTNKHFHRSISSNSTDSYCQSSSSAMALQVQAPVVACTSSTTTAQYPLDCCYQEVYRPYVEVIQLLLNADEALEDMNVYLGMDLRKRATLRQDVDGNVPLHLLVRQAFYNYIGGMTTSPSRFRVETGLQDRRPSPDDKSKVLTEVHPLLSVIYNVIESSPEACAIPDFTEFEETPLVLALKASIYAIDQHDHVHLSHNTMVNEDHDHSEFEWRIFELCKMMLDKNPYAASFVASKSKHTAVHSAVFHGRCCDTIRLLLKADSLYRKQLGAASKQPQGRSHNHKEYNPEQQMQHDHEHRLDGTILMSAAMRANRFGETPLHFAAMRGECTRTIKLLSEEAPWAALKRDIKYGMTPLHWLSVRFVDVMFERFRHLSFQESSIRGSTICNFDINASSHPEGSNDENRPDFNSSLKSSSESTTAAKHEFFMKLDKSPTDIEFDFEYHRRTSAIDPPVDYMRMRHILPEHEILKHHLMQRVSSVLMQVRQRHWKLMESMNTMALQGRSQQVEHNHGMKNNTVFSYKQNLKSSSYNCLRNPVNPFVNSSSHSHPVCLKEDFDADRRKCAVRCPFVFDSYPIAPPTTDSSQKDALREEQVISLFWAKVTSLLHASALAQSTNENVHGINMDVTICDHNRVFMLHSVCSGPSPFEIVYLLLCLYPEQLEIQDSTGKLPLHHAACRTWDFREFETDKDINSPNYIHQESQKVLHLIMQSSSKNAVNLLDSENRLPLHHAIDTIVKAVVDYPYRKKKSLVSVKQSSYADDKALYSSIEVLMSIIHISPETMEIRDGKTGLYPFMQVASTAAQRLGCYGEKKKSNAITLSLTYSLLLENPSLATNAIFTEMLH